MSKRESLLGKHGYAYGTLDAKEKAAYQQLYDAIANRDKIRLSDYPQLEPADISRLLACIDMDHPELFWMDGYQNRLAMNALIEEEDVAGDVWRTFFEGADYNNDGKISLFERSLAAARVVMDVDPTIQWAIKDELGLLPIWTERRVQMIQQSFDAYVRECRRCIPRHADDYLAFRRIFEYVAQHTSFTMRRNMRSEDVRSVFLNRESVCKGYAEALQYLLLDQGIPCFTVRGTSDLNEMTQSMHAWNYVFIGGEWNLVDITVGDWDLELKPDLMPDIPDDIRNQFVDYRCMSLDGLGYHPAEIVDYPQTGTTGSYFKHENYVLEQGDWVNLARMFLKLFNRVEPFVLAQVIGNAPEVEAWVRSETERVVKACVASGGSYESFMADPNRFLTLSERVNETDIAQTGWGGFSPSFEYLFPDDNVVLMTAPGKPPVNVIRR